MEQAIRRSAGARAERMALGGVVALFALTRWLYARQGIAFDWSGLDWFWQYIDVSLLRTDLARSLWYLHAQPPGFNLLLGAVVKLAPGHEGAAFHAVYLALGLLLHVCMFGLLVRLRVGVPIAFAATAVFMASPASILYENWLFYTHPAAALLMASALALHRLVDTGRAGRAFTFFALIAAIALVRSIFHVLWCVAAVGLALAAVPRPLRRRMLAAAAVPLGLVLLVYAKNAVIFGQFTASTWMGMNMAKVAIDRMEPARRARLIEAGVLSPLAGVRPFAPLGEYPHELADGPAPDIPVLRQREKPSGWANYNHYAYIGIARQFARDSLAAVRAAPDEATHEMALGLQVFALPSTDYWFLEPNRTRIEALDHGFDVVFQGTLSRCSGARPLRARRDGEDFFAARYLACNRSWLWLGYIAVGLIGGLTAGVSWLRRGAATPDDSAWAATLVYMGFTVVFVSIVGNAFELGENNRFRYMIDPLIWTLMLATVTATVRANRARGGPDQRIA